MKPLLSLDAHAHFDPARSPDELQDAGAVLAMTLSLDEATRVVGRSEPLIAWGVGCHPRKLQAQDAFNADQFGALMARSAVVGEVGLDAGSRVSLEQQLRIFRQVLAIVAQLPRLVSIHSYQATGLVIRELRRQPIATPVLHWWTGTVEETREAVALGCYFSVHSAVARHTKFRTAVPAERILVESDHGWADPPAAIPCRIEWVEYLMAPQLRLSREEVRRLAWQNLAAVIRETGTGHLLPAQLAALMAEHLQATDGG
jgi:TatD DNase family protein